MSSGHGQRDTLAGRAGASSWVGAAPGLADAVAVLTDRRGPAQLALADRAVALAQPGPVDPLRLARHATAAGVSRALRVATGLPAAVGTRRPLTDPAGFLRDATVEAVVDQLALGGAASAELARLVTGAGELFPTIVRDELARRHITAVDLTPGAVLAVIDRAFAGAGEGAVRLGAARPLTGTPVAGLYPASVEGSPALLRVRRPRVARDLVSDARLVAAVAAVMARLAPGSGVIGPVGFARLALRLHLEAIDLRFEALDLVELGLLLEELGRDGLVVARPRPGWIGERALAVEALDGVPLAPPDGARPPRREVDVAAVTPALVAITLESAIGRGVFWADPAPEHLLLRPDGRLALVGVGTVGRFTPELRLAGVRTLKAVLTGDYAGLIEGMRIAGALGPDVDARDLLDDLAANDRLSPLAVLTGGEAALLGAVRALVGILLAHRVEPPVEVTLLLRTIFALGRLLGGLPANATGGLSAALMGLLPRLPDLVAAAEGALD